MPSDEKVRRDEERKLQEKSEQEDADTIYDEVFDSANYDDHYMHIHMKADSSQKVHPTDLNYINPQPLQFAPCSASAFIIWGCKYIT